MYVVVETGDWNSCRLLLLDYLFSMSSNVFELTCSVSVFPFKNSDEHLGSLIII